MVSLNEWKRFIKSETTIFYSKLFELCDLYHHTFCFWNRQFQIEPRSHYNKRLFTLWNSVKVIKYKINRVDWYCYKGVRKLKSRCKMFTFLNSLASLFWNLRRILFLDVANCKWIVDENSTMKLHIFSDISR